MFMTKKHIQKSLNSLNVLQKTQISEPKLKMVSFHQKIRNNSIMFVGRYLSCVSPTHSCPCIPGLVDIYPVSTLVDLLYLGQQISVLRLLLVYHVQLGWSISILCISYSQLTMWQISKLCISQLTMYTQVGRYLSCVSPTPS